MQCPSVPAYTLVYHGSGIAGIARGLPAATAKQAKQVRALSVVASLLTHDD